MNIYDIIKMVTGDAVVDKNNNNKPVDFFFFSFSFSFSSFGPFTVEIHFKTL